MSAGAVSTSHEGHPRRGNQVLTALTYSLDSSLTAPTPGRASHRRPLSQHAPAAAPCHMEAGRTVGVWESGARAQRRRRHACAHARRRVGAPSPNPLPKDRLMMLVEIWFWEQGGILCRRGAGGDDSEVGGRTKGLHPSACPAEWKGSESGPVWALCSRSPWRKLSDPTA